MECSFRMGYCGDFIIRKGSGRGKSLRDGGGEDSGTIGAEGSE